MRLSTAVDGVATALLERERPGWHSPGMSNHPLRNRSELERLAALVGTPFYFYDADVIAQRIALIAEQIDAPGIQARYAMKACSAHRCATNYWTPRGRRPSA